MLLKLFTFYRMSNKIKRLSYSRLLKLLIDKSMNKQDLGSVANISATSIEKLGKGDNITTDVLLKICEGLDCNLDEIVETIKEDN